jgi:hypothetical protein
VDPIGDLVAAVEVDPGQHAGQRLGDVLEGVVVVVSNDHAPVSTQA